MSEKAGRLRIVEGDGTVGPPIGGVPAVDAGGQGGLLDVAADRHFARDRSIYFCFAEAGEGGNGTALARAQLAVDRTRLENVRVIFRQAPKVPSRNHFGCRIAEAPDGTLFLTLGDRFSQRDAAQRLDNHLGKIVRIGKDGSVPPGNPFAGRPGALPEIWSYGHRNLQGAAMAPDGTLWTHEHGPQGGDEINLPQPGRNYGWPLATYGEEYGGGRIGSTTRDGTEPPLHYWVPSIAPSGMAFLTSDRYGDWKGSLFVGSLKFGYLDRITLSGRGADAKVAGEQHLLADGRERIRDVRQGPDGWIYLLTDADDGRLLRLVRGR